MASSATTTTTSALSAHQRMIAHHMCPVEQQLLEKACSLVPCAHRVNEAAAEAIKASSGCCPVCREPITGVTVDAFVRESVEILKLGIDVAEAVKLVRLCLKPQALEYPGKNGDFVEAYSMFVKTWRPDYDTEWPICRDLAFIARNKDALIQYVSIRGRKLFRLQLFVMFNVKNREVLNQFLAYSFLSELPSSSDEGYFEDVQVKSFFKMFLQHNQVPEKYRSLLEKMTQVHTWDLLKEYPAKNAAYQLEVSPNTQTLTTDCKDALVSVIKLEKNMLTLTFNPLTQERRDYLDFMGFDGSSIITNLDAIVVMLKLLKKNNTFPEAFLIPVPSRHFYS